MATGPVISCRGLTCHAGGRTIIEDLSLDLDEGERVALMGPSGSGKTTLLTTLAGLAPPATAGRGCGTSRWPSRCCCSPRPSRSACWRACWPRG